MQTTIGLITAVCCCEEISDNLEIERHAVSVKRQRLEAYNSDPKSDTPVLILR